MMPDEQSQCNWMRVPHDAIEITRGRGKMESTLKQSTRRRMLQLFIRRGYADSRLELCLRALF